MLTIRELNERAKASLKQRTTREDAVRFMRNAKIVDESGYLNPEVFSPEAVAADRKTGKPFKV